MKLVARAFFSIIFQKSLPIHSEINPKNKLNEQKKSTSTHGVIMNHSIVIMMRTFLLHMDFFRFLPD